MKNVCVVIPIYNGELYLERCLSSIFKQTYKNIKVICINDGSTDSSLSILNSFKDKIVIINQENKGVSSARNLGLDYIFKNFKDCYISFIDCDDYVDSNYFEMLVKMLEDNSSDIVCTSFLYQYNNKSKKFNQISDDKIFSSFEANKILLKDETVQSHSHCKLFVSKVWDNVRFPENISWMEDQATIFKTFNLADKIFISNYAGYHYWQEGQSACRSSISNKKVIQSIKGYMIPYFYDDFNYSPIECEEIKKVSGNALANVFLMMISRFKRNFASSEELKEIKLIKKCIKENKVVKLYHPTNKKEKNKRFVYLYLRPFYSILYKLFSK